MKAISLKKYMTMNRYFYKGSEIPQTSIRVFASSNETQTPAKTKQSPTSGISVDCSGPKRILNGFIQTGKVGLHCCQRIVKKKQQNKTTSVMVWGCVSGFLKGPRCLANAFFRDFPLIPAGQEGDILLLTTVWLQGERED